MRRIRKGVEFEITPEVVDPGERWLTLTLKNISQNTLKNLDIHLNSVDTLGLEIRDFAKYIPLLLPDDEVNLYFRINVHFSTQVYVSMVGNKDDELFYWETPDMLINVSTQVAEIISLFATRNPRSIIGDTIKCDVLISAKEATEDLDLETWIEAPDGEIEEVELISLDTLAPNELKERTFEFIPKMKGIYTVKAQLFRGIRRLSSKTDYVYIKEI
ncbi:MAG: hypothetical protein ACLFPJ_03445 [Candidatus Woesearchaeota archaeon]